MTTANKITIFRVILIPFFLTGLLLSERLQLAWLRWAAFGIFALASISDFVDGYVARHYNQTSDFGKFLDPLADKLLVTACMLAFVSIDRMPCWLVFIVIAREFAVTGLRLAALQKQRVIAAGWSGKVKTFSTLVALLVMMAVSVPALDILANAVILGTTVYSGIEYFVRNRDIVKP